MHPRISIIINNYNYASYIGECIEAALNQDYPNVEVICVDDGSTDNSREIVQKYPQINQIFKANGGQASAARVGCRASTSQILIFLDSDDILFPHACSSVAAAWSPGLKLLEFRLRRFSQDQPDLGLTPQFGFSDKPIEELKKFGHFPASPTSGNAFDDRYARALLDIIPDSVPIDSALIFCAPFLGAIRAINACLGGYRVHGKNMSFANGSSLMKVTNKVTARRELQRIFETVANFPDALLGAVKPGYDAFYWRNELMLFICDASPRDPRHSPRHIARKMLSTYCSEPRFPFRTRILNVSLATAFLIVPNVSKFLTTTIVKRAINEPVVKGAAHVSWVFRKLSIIDGVVARRSLIRFLGNPERPTILGFLNAHGFNLAWSSSNIREAFLNTDILLRDGIGMKIFLDVNGMPAGDNTNGTDLIPELLGFDTGKRVALFGSRMPYVTRAAEALISQGISIVATVDGFQPIEAYVQAARSASADIFVLGMGMPKQEFVAVAIRNAVHHPCLIINGGAILDFMSGRVVRAPKLVQRLGLEWLFRLCLEPQRLFSRYVIGNVIFLWRTYRVLHSGGSFGSLQKSGENEI
jgi:exopolysaccharide biosynthesis WecB/TagA/CpsF family protein